MPPNLKLIQIKIEKLAIIIKTVGQIIRKNKV